MKNLVDNNKKLWQFLFALGLIGGFSLFGFLGLALGSYWTRHALTHTGRLSNSQTRFWINVSFMPGKIRIAKESLINSLSKEPLPSVAPGLFMHKKHVEKSGWLRRFPVQEDDGFLLLSGIDPNYQLSNVRLIRIRDGAILKTWNPDWQNISYKAKIRNSHKGYEEYKQGIYPFILGHPLPLPTGEIIVGGLAGHLIKMSACNNKPEEVFEHFVHHSIELDDNNPDNLKIVTPSINRYYFSDSNFLKERLRDDSILEFSIDGKSLRNRSFSKILIDNGLESLLFGHMGSAFEPDPIHLNQISIAKSDGKKWLKGDYLISARNLSSIFLYRPSSNQVIWHQSGPWKNQHSVHFIDQNQIALFDNNVYVSRFVRSSDINRVFVIDFSSGSAKISQPFENLLESDYARPTTATGGIARVLPDGGLFLEETAYGRHLRFTSSDLLWSRVNDYNKDIIGAVNWSRYLTKVEGETFWRQIQDAEKSCLLN
jgi:hypothetical protein